MVKITGAYRLLAGKERIQMEQYNVTGMSCAACSARVEKAVSKVPGVTVLLSQPSDQLHGSGRNGFVHRTHSLRQ